MPRTTETGRHHAKKHIGTDKQCTSLSKAGVRCERHVVSVKAGQDVVYGTVCYRHGGKRQKRRLIRELQQKKLERVARRIGTPIEIDPADALLQQVWEAAGNVAVYREKVRLLQVPHDANPILAYPELFGREAQGTKSKRVSKQDVEDPKSVDFGTAEMDEGDEEFPEGYVKGRLYGPDHLGDLAPHVLIKLYNDERERLVKFIKVAIECGIMERQQKLAEYQTQVIVQIVLHMLDHPSMMLTADQRMQGRRIITDVLREYSNVLEGKVEALGSGG